MSSRGRLSWRHGPPQPIHLSSERQASGGGARSCGGHGPSTVVLNHRFRHSYAHTQPCVHKCTHACARMDASERCCLRLEWCPGVAVLACFNAATSRDISALRLDSNTCIIRMSADMDLVADAPTAVGSGGRPILDMDQDQLWTNTSHEPTLVMDRHWVSSATFQR